MNFIPDPSWISCVVFWYAPAFYPLFAVSKSLDETCAIVL